jgi:hypothetical protein
MADEATHVELVRSGGLAGLSLTAAVAVDDLPQDTADTVRGALDKVDLAGLAERPVPAPSGADRFQYDLTVTRGGQRHSVTLPESHVPPELKPVLDALMPLAQPRS